MPISHLLEDFSAPSHTQGRLDLSDDILEELRLSAFENGYQAGWDDASAAHAAEQAHISSDFSQNLQSLNFTYQEAYCHIMAMLKPLLIQMVETILPQVAHKTLGMRIVSEVIDLAQSHSNQKIELIMSPISRIKLENLSLPDLTTTIQFIDDESLSEGQVFLKAGQSERRIDLDGLLDDMKLAIDGFVHEFEKESQYGR